jgi:hypothetical protein
MKEVLKLLGISTCLLGVAVFATGLSPAVIAQNASQNASGGLEVPTNATGAESSPEAMNNTLAPVGPENETVITP